MDVFLPEGFEPGLRRPHMGRPARTRNLCVSAAGVIYPVLRRWASGFSVSAEDVPTLSGVVDLYDGAEHLHQCLITQCEQRDGEIFFTIKRSSGVDYRAVFDMDGDFQRAAR